MSKKRVKNEKRYYFAYGSNLNLEHMASRCPGAKVYKRAYMLDYRLEFSSVLTVQRRKCCVVPGALYEITPEDEKNLDVYEGFPRLYGKKVVKVFDWEGNKIKAMVYIKNQVAWYPSHESYYKICLQGFKDWGLPAIVLEQAQKRAIGCYTKAESDYGNMITGGRKHRKQSKLYLSLK